MERVEAYVHQAGRYCGAVAPRTVATYYGWNYSEAACFGFGGGAAFVRYGGDDPAFEFLDPAHLSHLPRTGHVPPHVALLAGDVADREERPFRELANELAVEPGR